MKRIALAILTSVLLVPSAFAQEIETKSLDQLYADAIAEGGELVIRAGGDKDDQADYYLDMFKKRFPDIKLTHSVDLSFYHASRYDNARKDDDTSDVPDIIQLQTLHDFDYYAERGLLERYKPKNWEMVYPDYKDPHGNWTGLFGVAFTNVYNNSVIADADAPHDALDYLDPALKGKLILTYPHTDDAVLYQFWNLKEKYGWEYLEKLVATDPTWVRGTSMPYVAIDNGWYPVPAVARALGFADPDLSIFEADVFFEFGWDKDLSVGEFDAWLVFGGGKALTAAHTALYIEVELL